MKTSHVGKHPVSPRASWVDLKDENTRRRERELKQVEKFIKDVLHNPNNGLFRTLGPSVGITGEYCVLGLDGNVLGNADQAAPGLDRGVRVINIPPELQGKVGQPDFKDIKFGITGTGGEVYAAEFKPPTLKEAVYPTHIPDTKPLQEHPKSGQVKVIGRVALREPDRTQAMRILVMGGQRQSRDDVIRWYCGVRRFVYGNERDALQAALDKLTKKPDQKGPQDSKPNKSTEIEKEKPEPSVSAASAQHVSPSELEEKIARLDENFHIICTWHDKSRAEQYHSLKHELEAKKKNETDPDESSSASALSDDADDFEKEEKKKAVAAEISDLESKLASFRHVQGSHSPFAKIIDPDKKLGREWSILHKKEALALLYYAAEGKSSLSRYGNANDFSKYVARAVKGYVPGQDFLAYMQGEVLLCLADASDARAACTPPENLMFINCPDLVNASEASSRGSEALAILERERARLVPLLPRLLQILRQADSEGDGSQTIDRIEFVKAFDALQLEPAISKDDLLKLFQFLDPDGGNTIEVEDIELVFEVSAGKSREAGYAQEQAFLLLGDVADKILVLLDAKRSRMNAAELRIIKRLYEKYPTKLQLTCAQNHKSKDAMKRSMIDLLGEPSVLDGFTAIAPDNEDIIPFMTDAVNAQEQQASSLLMGLSINFASMLTRLSALYAEAQANKQVQNAGAVIDPTAIALLNQNLSDALRNHLRTIPKGAGHLMVSLKHVMKKALVDSEQLLRRSGIVPLSLEKRRDMWRREREETEAARRDVLDALIANWSSARHVQVWLETLAVSEEARRIFSTENVACLQDLLRVDDDKLQRWHVPVGDRLRIRKGLVEVKKRVARYSTDFLKDGLWWMLSTEKHNQTKVKVNVPQEMLFDQGYMAPPNLKGLRTGDVAVLECAGHGKILLRIPERSELEGRQFEVELDRLKGGHPAYVDTEDLSVMYGLLLGDIQSNESSKAILRDGLHLLLTGDAPPQLIHDLVCDLRLELEDVLGYGWCQSFADDKENVLRGPTHNTLPSTARLANKVHGRRWKLEEAEREAALSSSESEDENGLDGIDDDKKSWHDKLPHILLEIFNKCSGGGVVAEGHALEEAMLQHRRLRAILGAAGVEFGYGTIKLLKDTDVLKSEFLRDVRKVLDHEAASSSDLSSELSASDDD